MIHSIMHRHLPALAQWWERASARERLLVATAALLVVATVVWIAVWQPMLSDIVDDVNSLMSS